MSSTPFAPQTPNSSYPAYVLDYIPDKIKPQTPVLHAMNQISLLQLQLILKYKPIALLGEDPEGVHKVRVGLRRFRTSLRLFKPYIKKEVYKFLNSESKSIARELGALRDLDVLNIHFNNYIQQFSDKTEYANDWETAFSHQYSIVSASARAHLSSDSFDTLASTILQLKDSTIIAKKTDGAKGNLPGTIKEFLPKKIYKKFSQIQSYKGKISPQTDYASYHQLRLEFKKFRYTLEFFSDVLDKHAMKQILDLLVEIQDQLGYLNDDYTANKILIKQKNQLANWSTRLTEYQNHRQEEYNRRKNDFLFLWNEFNQEEVVELIHNKLTSPLD